MFKSILKSFILLSLFSLHSFDLKSGVWTDAIYDNVSKHRTIFIGLAGLVGGAYCLYKCEMTDRKQRDKQKTDLSYNRYYRTRIDWDGYNRLGTLKDKYLFGSILGFSCAYIFLIRKLI